MLWLWVRIPLVRLMEIEDDVLIEIVKNSTSLRQVLLKLGLSYGGRPFNKIKNQIKQLNCDTSHFTGAGWLRGKTHSFNRTPHDELFVENGNKNSRGGLKRVILRDKLLENKCGLCGQGDNWNGMKLVMVLDHINGINTDHRLENLRFVCPNCNSQLPTFTGRNVKRK